MMATPQPVTKPPSSSLPCMPAPTRNSPIPTTTTATNALNNVSGRLYKIVTPGTVNPSIAMKCITQIPVAPIDTAPSSSQLIRDEPVDALARAVLRRPRNAPVQDIVYANAGASGP